MKIIVYKKFFINLPHEKYNAFLFTPILLIYLKTLIVMKRYLLTLILLIATSFVAQNLFADNFSVTNSDGVTITYNTLSETTCQVFRGNYSGISVLNIPSTVKYNNTTYTVTTIGNYAFFDSYDLTSVTIPNTVQSIGYGAFYGCSSLTSIKIPDSVISISDFAFSDCYQLAQLTLGKKLQNIGGQAFSSCSITTLTLPNSLMYIGENAFSYCIGLTSVMIPKSVVSIDDNPFSDCSQLTSIVVESGNTNYNSNNNCNAIIENSSKALISGCKNTVIPNDITSINDHAFAGCDGLTKVTIPNTVTSIGGWAFLNCNSLTSIKIPKGVTSIGNMAFTGCNSLESIVVESGNSIYNSANDCNAIIETSSKTLIIGCRYTVIPNTTLAIAENAFKDCQYLTSIKIPKSVTSIGNNAFANCYNLGLIVVESGNPNYNSDNDCNAIIETSTKTLIVGCRNTVIPNTVEIIGDYAFQNSYFLKTMKIPNSVKTIGKNAFSNCRSLTEVNIPNSVTSIGDYAFAFCYNLEKIISEIIDVSNTEINTYSFWDNDKATLYVPKGTGYDYLCSAVWNRINRIREIPKAGDTNEDGEISISDVVSLVNRILSDSDSYYFYDTNDDGIVDVNDVVKLVNMILGE